MTMIRLEKVDFAYRVKDKTVPVLAELSAGFERGTITAIVGRSGCGKTSLLRLLSGLSIPTSGSIRIEGEPGGSIREKTSIIFQDFGLLPWASVQSNAELGLKVRKYPREERRARVTPILEELGLGAFSRFYPARLSGGMRQRVAVARALASDSDVLLLDEPFSSLDALTRESLQDSLLEAQRSHGTTIVLVTHSIEEAAYLADAVYVLEGKNPARLSAEYLTAKGRARTLSAGTEHKAPPSPPVRAEIPGGGYRESEAYFTDVRAIRHRFAAESPLSREENEPGTRHAPVRAGKEFLARLVKLSLAILLVFGFWQLLSLIVSAPFLPSPSQALLRFFTRTLDGTLIVNSLASLRRIVLALAFAGPAAWALGLAAGRSRTADTLASPLVYLFHPLPKVAFLPLLMLFFGLGDASKVALMGLVIFGQLFVGARDSVRAIPSTLIDTVTSLGGGRWTGLRLAILPATLPALLSSLRISLGTAIAVLFLSETFASMDGLGWYIMDAWSRVDYPDMYAAIMALSAVGLILYLLLDAIEALALAWRET